MDRRSECKLDVVAERYGLSHADYRAGSLDDRLAARWTGADGRPSEGYKSLAKWFNKRLLGRLYDEHGRETIGTRLNSDYEAIVGDDDLLRGEVADDLAADGIDAERVRKDMISWSTMRTHLKECLEAEKPSAEAETDWERRSIDRARRIVTEKTEDALRSLAGKGDLPGGDGAGVEVDVHLTCPACPTRIRLVDAIDRGYVCEHLTPDGSVESGTSGE